MTATLTADAARGARRQPGTTAAAGISTAFLLVRDRVTRLPLTPWAERVAGGLAQALRTVRAARELSAGVAQPVNNAALIASYHGDRTTAWSLCELHLHWQHRLSRRAADPAITGRCLDPWVNLGRLEALSGECEAALARFATLNEYRLGGRLALGAVGVDGSAWEVAAPSRESFEQVLESISVLESFKALFQARRFAEAAAFAEHTGPRGSPGIARFVDEATVIAAGRLGDFARAAEVAGAAARVTRGWEHVVFRLRLAEAVVCAGEPERAAAIVRPLAAAAGRVSLERRRDLQVVAVLLRLAEVCGEVGLDEEGRGLAESAYAGATDARDEGFRIESLRALAASAPRHEGWSDLLRSAEAATEYRRYRRAEGTHSSPALERMYAEAVDALSG